ncbi:hypothetical protein [Helicobacter sp. T3_23-1056]
MAKSIIKTHYRIHHKNYHKIYYKIYRRIHYKILQNFGFLANERLSTRLAKMQK